MSMRFVGANRETIAPGQEVIVNFPEGITPEVTYLFAFVAHDYVGASTEGPPGWTLIYDETIGSGSSSLELRSYYKLFEEEVLSSVAFSFDVDVHAVATVLAYDGSLDNESPIADVASDVFSSPSTTTVTTPDLLHTTSDTRVLAIVATRPASTGPTSLQWSATAGDIRVIDSGNNYIGFSIADAFQESPAASESRQVTLSRPSSAITHTIALRPARFIYDYIIRDDSGVLGTASSGHVWDEAEGNWYVESNQIRFNGGGINVAGFPTGSANVSIETDITLSASQSAVGAVFRYRDSDNYLFVKVREGSEEKIILRKKEGSLDSELDSAPISVDSGQSVQLTVRADGANITVYLDGEQYIDHTLSDGDVTNFGSATYHGVWARIDSNQDNGGSRFTYLSISPIDDGEPSRDVLVNVDHFLISAQILDNSLTSNRGETVTVQALECLTQVLGSTITAGGMRTVRPNRIDIPVEVYRLPGTVNRAKVQARTEIVRFRAIREITVNPSRLGISATVNPPDTISVNDSALVSLDPIRIAIDVAPLEYINSSRNARVLIKVPVRVRTQYLGDVRIVTISEKVTAPPVLLLSCAAVVPVAYIPQFPILAPGQKTTIVTVRVYDRTGAILGTLPDWSSLAFQEVLNDAAAFTLSYPARGRYAELLTSNEEREIAFFVNGVERYRGLIEEDSWEEIDETKTLLTFSGRNTIVTLDQAVVYPPGGIAVPGPYEFIDCSPGTIMRTLISVAQQRGAIERVDCSSFTAVHDSAGRPWTHTALNVKYEAFTDLFTVLRHLAEVGTIDFRMNGYRLELYNPNTTMGTLRSNAVLARGRDVASASRTRSRRDHTTVMVVAGDESTLVERTDQSAIDTYGRKERRISLAGTTDPNTLSGLGDAYLLARKDPRISRQHTLAITAGGPQPWVDFRAGDYVLSNAGTATPQRYRVRQMSLATGSDGVLTSEIILNDRFVQLEEALARRISGISVGSGIGAIPGPIIPPGADLLPPAAPDSVLMSHSTYTDIAGTNRARLELTWPEVTLNADGTRLTDLAGYEVAWRYEGEAWQAAGIVDATRASFLALDPGRAVDARVRSFDTNSNYSAWVEANDTLAVDRDAPPVPSEPVLLATFGGLQVTWDGLGLFGEPMPDDYSHTEIHAYPVPPSEGAESSSETRVGELRGSLTTTLSALLYNTDYYVWLVSVDTDGHHSRPGPAAKESPNQVTGTDIQPLTLGNELFATDAVDARVLRAGAITAEHLTVASFGANVIPNWSFEDKLSTDPSRATSWDYDYVGRGKGYGLNATALSGSGALQMYSLNEGAPAAIASRAVAVSPGQQYMIVIPARSTQTMGRASVGVFFGTSETFSSDLRSTGIPTAESSSPTALATGSGYAWFANSVTLSTNWNKIKGLVTVPADARYMRIVLQTTSATYPLIIDSTSVQLVTVAAKIEGDQFLVNKLAARTIRAGDAVIDTAAINAAMINDLRADQITSGRVTANITIAGSFSTSDTVPMVRMDSAGIVALDAQNHDVFRINAQTGSAMLAGRMTTRAGDTGEHIVIESTSDGDKIEFFSSDPTEFQPATIHMDPATDKLIVRGAKHVGPDYPEHQAPYISLWDTWSDAPPPDFPEDPNVDWDEWDLDYIAIDINAGKDTMSTLLIRNDGEGGRLALSSDYMTAFSKNDISFEAGSRFVINCGGVLVAYFDSQGFHSIHNYSGVGGG